LTAAISGFGAGFGLTAAISGFGAGFGLTAAISGFGAGFTAGTSGAGAGFGLATAFADALLPSIRSRTMRGGSLRIISLIGSPGLRAVMRATARSNPSTTETDSTPGLLETMFRGWEAASSVTTITFSASPCARRSTR
jgi:hypothetical protein